MCCVPSAAWAQAVAALMIIGLILLIIAFIISCIALCCTLNVALAPLIGGLVILTGKAAHHLIHHLTVTLA